ELAAQAPRLRPFALQQFAAVVALERRGARDHDSAPAAQEAATEIVPFIDPNAIGRWRAGRRRGWSQAVALRLLAAGSGRAEFGRASLVVDRLLVMTLDAGVAAGARRRHGGRQRFGNRQGIDGIEG